MKWLLIIAACSGPAPESCRYQVFQFDTALACLLQMKPNATNQACVKADQPYWGMNK